MLKCREVRTRNWTKSKNQNQNGVHFGFKWCFSVFRGTKYNDIRPNHTKKQKQPKTNTHSFYFLWTGQGTFLVQDFHRPNCAKILRFPWHPGCVENCQKSKSFSKIWLWKSWKIAIIFWPAQIFLVVEFTHICYKKVILKNLRYFVANFLLSRFTYF